MQTSYWNNQLYHEIDKTVTRKMADLKRFFAGRPVTTTTDERYQKYIHQVTETYSKDNTFGTSLSAAKHTELPLVSKSQTVWYYGDAINQAIIDAHSSGGSVVVVPDSGSKNANQVFYSGAIRLLSRVELRIESGATIKFMRNRTNAYYPVVQTSYEGSDIYNFSPLIYALGQENIAITGGGTLDGQEDMWNWRPWKKGYWQEPNVENHEVDADYGQNGILSVDNFENHPLSHRIFTDDGHRPEKLLAIGSPDHPLASGMREITPLPDARVLKSAFRPTFIEPTYCRNVLISGITLLNAPFWQVHPANSENVMVEGIRIWSDKTTGYEVAGWNNDDGIDPDSCKNVILQNNHIYVSDDGTALKAFRSNDAFARHQPTQNAIIRNSDYANKAGNSAAISAGSDMSGGIKNVFIENISFTMAQPLKLKTNAYRGGYIENIYMRNCTTHHVRFTLVRFQSDYPETLPVAHQDLYDPIINNVFIDNVHSDTAGNAPEDLIEFDSSASRSPISNVFIRNTSFSTVKAIAKSFATCHFIRNLTLETVTLYDPVTQKKRVYNTSPLPFVNQVTAHLQHGKPIKLVNASDGTRFSALTRLGGATFTLSGKLADTIPADTNSHFSIYLDRDKHPITCHLNADGEFQTEPIALTNEAYWYRGRHYIALNIYRDDLINTAVYRVTV